MSFETPGVYVEEKPTTPPIQGVSTSVAAFIGVGPTQEYPKPITSFDDFTSRFATQKVLDQRKSDAANHLKKADAEVEEATAGVDAAKGDDLEAAQSALDLAKKRQKEANAKLKTAEDAANETLRSTELYHVVKGFFTNGGSRCYVGGVAMINDDSVDTALSSFAAVDEISIVALAPAPSLTADLLKSTQNKIVTHCQTLKDRFAVLCCHAKPANANEVSDVYEKGALDAAKAKDQAAVYAPWLRVQDAEKQIAIPPTGHIAGVYASVDGRDGSHKAPANEGIRGALATCYAEADKVVPALYTDAQQGALNKAGINLLREFTPGQIIVWGARTWTSQATYVSTRRYMNYINESIEEGTRFAVFEPNNRRLWQRLIRAVRGFLYPEWQKGALFGDTPDEAFFVRCDEALNNDDTRKRGEVIVEVGVRLAYPAEFVIFRIQQVSDAF